MDVDFTQMGALLVLTGRKAVW